MNFIFANDQSEIIMQQNNEMPSISHNSICNNENMIMILQLKTCTTVIYWI